MPGRNRRLRRRNLAGEGSYRTRLPIDCWVGTGVRQHPPKRTLCQKYNAEGDSSWQEGRCQDQLQELWAQKSIDTRSKQEGIRLCQDLEEESFLHLSNASPQSSISPAHSPMGRIRSLFEPQAFLYILEPTLGNQVTTLTETVSVITLVPQCWFWSYRQIRESEAKVAKNWRREREGRKKKTRDPVLRLGALWFGRHTRFGKGRGIQC